MNERFHVGFVGNPNCGKTTLFNAYTGAKLKVANWPGVTVEKKEGAMKYHDNTFKLVDLPGIYSLTSYTMEEKLTREYLLEDDVDVIIDVADASALERNLYLTLSTIELEKPVVLALNMMDIVEERGMEIDLHRLPEMLGIPVIPVSARKRTGLDILMHAVAHHREEGVDEKPFHYSHEVEDKINEIMEILEEKVPGLSPKRWYAIKLLENDEEIVEQYGEYVAHIIDRNYENDIVRQKYAYIEEIMEEVLVNKEKKEALTDKIDSYLTHSILGVPIFLGIMALVFFLTFTIGDFLKGYLEGAIALFSNGVMSGLEYLGVGHMIRSLIVDGIIAGVGGILSFLPNIFILFLALAFLEDSGYMSRVAYVMDGIMGKLGLSGRAFIPMLLGFGCSVPAVMASRVLEDQQDRKRTILITPFMSCSAKLPVYVTFSGLFFGKYAMLSAYSMYIIGLVLGILVAFIHSKLMDKGRENPLLIELPEYKMPNFNTISIYVGEKVKDYLSKAGTTIFVASIIVWIVLNFGSHGMVSDMSQSFGATFGRFLVPILAPAGLGLWQIAVMLISGLAAKEVVVSSFLVLFGISSLTAQGAAEGIVSMMGAMGFGPLNAYALMVFTLLYTPCLATVATIKRETNSWKWTIGLVFFQLVIAWICAVLVFQVGSFFFA